MSRIPDPLGRPDRPDPPVSPLAMLIERVRFVGVGRVIATAVAAIAAMGVGWWLTRAPTPPAEMILPVSSVPSSSATLAPPSSTVGEPTSAVVVHVAGAVVSPGVYTVPDGARVHDAVLAAGGPIDGADLDRLNLAAHLGDAERVYVPLVGEDEVMPLTTPSAGEQGPAQGMVNLNRADADELETLPGIGPATAAAIIDDRQRNGPFATVDDLERVSGIGPATLERLRDLVTV